MFYDSKGNIIEEDAFEPIRIMVSKEEEIMYIRLGKDFFLVVDHDDCLYRPS